MMTKYEGNLTLVISLGLVVLFVLLYFLITVSCKKIHAYEENWNFSLSFLEGISFGFSGTSFNIRGRTLNHVPPLREMGSSPESPFNSNIRRVWIDCIIKNYSNLPIDHADVPSRLLTPANGNFWFKKI